MDETKYPRMCPRWQLCSVNQCPLDALQAVRVIHPNDPEQVCKSNIRERLEIIAKARAEGVELGDGMTEKERKSGWTVEELATERDRITADRRAKGLLLSAKTRQKSGVDVKST